jgi:L-threonylcarbamoyladenylate synthase
VATDRNQIAEAARRIRAGGVVAFPTETVYGLAADALNPDAVRAVYDLKGRPADRPMSVIVSGTRMAQRVVRSWPKRARELADRFWPGPLAIVVPRAADLPHQITAGRDGVGLRCPDHPIALALLETCGFPLLGPSANRSGQPSPTTANHVRRAFPDTDLLVLDGGPCRTGIESTIIEITPAGERIVRAGAISPEELGLADDATPEGVGAPMRLPVEDSQRPIELFAATDWDTIRSGREGKIVALTLTDGLRLDPPHEVVRMPADPGQYASDLYAAILAAAASGADHTLVEIPQHRHGLWATIHARLNRLAKPTLEQEPSQD